MDNLSWKANAETALVAIDTPKPVGQKVNFTAGKDVTIDLGNTDKLATLSLDYKIKSGEKFAIALMPNWESYYGYFDITEKAAS